MIALPSVVLDACVIVNFSLCDTLLRLAEPPRLYHPKWSDEIIQETIRTLESKLGWPTSLVAHFTSELRIHFADSWVLGYEPLLNQMTNDNKDRHVVAAAVHGGVEAIVTFNLRHFDPRHLKPWGIRAIHPEVFLIEIFQFEPSLTRMKLEQQALDRSRTLKQLLDILRSTVPAFVSLVESL